MNAGDGRVNRKGVCYDVGRILEGSNQRPSFDISTVRREIRIIREELNCNAIRIQGYDLDRLRRASEYALELGLEVWFSPEMFEHSRAETLSYIVEAAGVAESLRSESNSIVFSLGSELTLFMQGIVEGGNLVERMGNPSFREVLRAGSHNEPLNSFLHKENSAVRETFGGKVTYFSLPFENVDWSCLDFVGADLYRSSDMKDTYSNVLHRLQSIGKPVVIGEFGCCTYRGAEQLGGQGWAIAYAMIAEILGLSSTAPHAVADVLKIPARIDGHFVRDEELQARELVDQLKAMDEAGVEGAFVFTFVSPLSHHNENPMFDFDLPSYSLVKSYPVEEDMKAIVEQVVKQGKELFGVDVPETLLYKLRENLGRHGAKHRDLPWDPKLSFGSVADYYASH